MAPMVRGPLLVVLLTLPALAGCMGADDRQPNQDVRERWRSEASSHAPMGYEATFDLVGDPVALVGAGARASWTAPFALAVERLFPSQEGYVYFADASVAGVGTGLLVLEGSRMQASAGSVGQAPLRHALASGAAVALALDPPEGLVDKPSAEFPDAWSEANRSLFFAEQAPVQVGAWTLSGFARGVLLTASGAHDVTGSVSFSASSWFWASTSRVEAAVAQITADTFSVAGNITGGRVLLSGRAAIERPLALFGAGAQVEVSSGGIRSLAPARVTQVLTDDGLALEAEVELVANEETLAVERGRTAWASVSYRETTYRGDAVLKDVAVTGPGAALIEVPVRKPPLMVEELFGLLEDVARDAPWIAPLVALPLVVAAPWVAMVDVLLAVVCAFSDCPERYPYPMWMGAGDVGLFFVKASGDAAPGDYPATITFTGQNHGPVAVSLTVRVVG